MVYPFCEPGPTSDAYAVEATEHEDGLVLVGPDALSDRDGAVGRNVVHVAHHVETHGLGSFRGEGLGAMVREVRARQASELPLQHLEPRHRCAPAAKDADDGQRVCQSGARLDAHSPWGPRYAHGRSVEHENGEQPGLPLWVVSHFLRSTQGARADVHAHVLPEVPRAVVLFEGVRVSAELCDFGQSFACVKKKK